MSRACRSPSILQHWTPQTQAAAQTATTAPQWTFLHQFSFRRRRQKQTRYFLLNSPEQEQGKWTKTFHFSSQKNTNTPFSFTFQFSKHWTLHSSSSAEMPSLLAPSQKKVTLLYITISIVFLSFFFDLPAWCRLPVRCWRGSWPGVATEAPNTVQNHEENATITITITITTINSIASIPGIATPTTIVVIAFIINTIIVIASALWFVSSSYTVLCSVLIIVVIIIGVWVLRPQPAAVAGGEGAALPPCQTENFWRDKERGRETRRIKQITGKKCEIWLLFLWWRQLFIYVG